MGLAYEVLTGRATNPGATPTALTANSGDSFVVRAFTPTSNAYLEDVFASNANGGILRIRSPRLHDNVQGIRVRVAAGVVRGLLPDRTEQRLYPQDSLTVETTGGSAETDVGAITTYYQDLPGTDARLALWEQVAPRIANILTVEVGISAASTDGDWSAGDAIDSTFDLLKANTDYAVLGYETDVAVAAVALRGPDTGNLRVGGPGTTEAIETRDYFVRQAVKHNTPHIPILNAANKGATLAYQVDSEAGAVNDTDFVLAELTA